MIAAWELITGHHLAGDFVSNAPQSVVTGVVISTFENPNNYGAFLILCVPFVYWFYLRTLGLKRIIFIVLGIVLLLLLVKTRSRGSLIDFVIQLIVILLMNARRIRSTAVKFTVLVCIILAIVGALVLEPSIVHKMLGLYTELTQFGSASERLNLYANGMQFAWESHLLGIGSGAFEFYMQNGYGALPTGHDIDPHNFWIQILSQYGVIVFVPFLWWLIRCVKVGIDARRSALTTGANKMVAATECLLIGLVGYPLAAMEHSSYIKEPTNWMFIASVLLLSAYAARELRAGAEDK